MRLIGQGGRALQTGLKAGVLLVALGFGLAAVPAGVSHAGKAVAQEGPFVKKHLYSETADPQAEVDAGIRQARATHKRVILDFGGDWCPDCQVLDVYFHQAPNAELLSKHFVLVHVFIGHMDKNLDLAARYGVPISKGVPALAVLDDHGKVLYSQTTGQFNSMRSMDVSSVTEFLNRWKS